MIEKYDAKALAPTVWHKNERTLLLGCGGCPDREVCGGLQIQASILSCEAFCCRKPNTCSIVCPNKADFARRVHEVRGFDLMDIEKRKRLFFSDPPEFIPLVYRSLPLLGFVPANLVAVPFSEAYRRRGQRATPLSRRDLNAKFRLAPYSKLVLSGVEHDRHVEQWWGSSGRKEVLEGMREMGIAFVTVPNFSAAADVPRHANLHSLKRIALCWAELHDAGIPAAVHANCRTNYDFVRFGRFLKFHDEIEAIAFEYTTGTANEESRQYFTSLLCQLADEVGRPIKLILRGGLRSVATLSSYYDRVVMLDSTACMKTIHRERGVFQSGDKLRWRKNPTRKGEPLDDLLAQNIRVVAKCTSRYWRDPESARAVAMSNRQLQAYDEPL